MSSEDWVSRPPQWKPERLERGSNKRLTAMRSLALFLRGRECLWREEDWRGRKEGKRNDIPIRYIYRHYGRCRSDRTIAESELFLGVEKKEDGEIGGTT